MEAEAGGPPRRARGKARKGPAGVHDPADPTTTSVNGVGMMAEHEFEVNPVELWNEIRSEPYPDIEDHPDEVEHREMLRELTLPLREVFPEELAVYEEWFVKFFPKSRHYVRKGYDSPFYEVKYKKTGRPVPLYEERLHELLEKHLDYERYGDHLYAHRRKDYEQYFRPEKRLWLGMLAGRRTQVGCLDIDCSPLGGSKKHTDLGWYRFSDKSPVMPAKRCTLSYLRKLKAIYDRFRTFDVWCISSESLGMHAWHRFDRPMPTEDVVRYFEKGIRDLGLDGVEVYPRFGRCLRRPFGADYRTIIPATHERACHIDKVRGGLTCWIEQIQHFVNPGPRPSFDEILKALYVSFVNQLLNWQRYSYNDKRHPIDVQAEFANLQAVMRQAKAGNFDEGQEPLPSPGQLITNPLHPQPKREKAPASASGVSGSVFENVPGRTWPQKVLGLARQGLPASGTLGKVAYEFAKWLLWVEYHGVVDKQPRAVGEIVAWLRRKHNGHSRRMALGDIVEVERQVANAVEQARKINRPESLGLFANIRRKRDAGRYKVTINIGPLLRGEAVEGDESPPSPGQLIMYPLHPTGKVDLDRPLPTDMQALIKAEAGRNKVMRFATRLINHLEAKGGSARVCRDRRQKEGRKDTLVDFLGYKGIGKIDKYVHVLIRDGALRKGRPSSQGNASREYVLTELARKLLKESPSPGS